MTTGLDKRIGELRAKLAQRNMAVVSSTCHAEQINGHLLLNFWDEDILITLPDFIAWDAVDRTELDPLSQALVATYLQTSDGTLPAGEWIAFTDLTDGRFYTQAFQGYTGRELAAAFGEDIDRFREAALALGGLPVALGTAAFRFQAVPLLPVCVVCWLGDEDFPSVYKILFDANSNHHLSTDGCAILGSMLTRRLLA